MTMNTAATSTVRAMVAAFKGGALAPIPAEYRPDDQSARYDFSAVDKVAITWPRPHGRPITFASY